MDKTITYYYKLEVDNFSEVEDYYTFTNNSMHYYFVPYKRPIEDFNDIILVMQELITKKIPVDEIKINKDGSYLTKVSDISYVLLKATTFYEEEYDLNQMSKWNASLVLNDTKSKLYRNDWGNLWSSKIDYFEYQIREIGKDKKIIIQSFSYYVGLAENAISYANRTVALYPKTNLDRITLCHRRIFSPNYKLSFCNPISFIFDLEVRDVAGYVKAMFFRGIDVYDELASYLKGHTMSIYGYQMLYARLLYPSYYFDIYEDVMNRKTEEKDLLPIIDLAEDYEKFLARVEVLLESYAPIERIDWIAKKASQ